MHSSGVIKKEKEKKKLIRLATILLAKMSFNSVKNVLKGTVLLLALHTILHWLWVWLRRTGFSGTYASQTTSSSHNRVVSPLVCYEYVAASALSRPISMTAFSMIFLFILCALQRVVWLDNCRRLLFSTTIFIVCMEFARLAMPMSVQMSSISHPWRNEKERFFPTSNQTMMCALCSVEVLIVCDGATALYVYGNTTPAMYPRRTAPLECGIGSRFNDTIRWAQWRETTTTKTRLSRGHFHLFL